MNLPIVVADGFDCRNDLRHVVVHPGRQRGSAVLRFICRISLETGFLCAPHASFVRTPGRVGVGDRQFVPGLSAMTAPLAGTSRMPGSGLLSTMR